MDYRPVVANAMYVGLILVSLSKRSAYSGSYFVPIAGLLIFGAVHATTLSPDFYFNEIFTRYCFILLAHQSFLHCIVPPAELDEERNAYILKTGGSPGQRSYMFAYKLLWNPRMIGTRWEAKIRTHSAPAGAQNATNPSPQHWPIIKRFSALLCRFSVLCVYYDPAIYGYTPEGTPPAHNDFAPTSPFSLSWLPCLFGVCANSTVMRATVIRVHTLFSRTFTDYLTLSCYHDVLAITATLVGLDTLDEWPPLFGDPRQAYTVRRYWARYWHLLIYRSFTAHAGWFGALVGIRRRSPLGRYVNNAMVFVLSGLMHTAVSGIIDAKACSRCGCWGIFWWFSIQFFGILAETVVQELFLWLIKRWNISDHRSRLSNAISKAVGYVWVASWIIWSIERTEFPFFYCLTDVAPRKGTV